ncbi:MAG: hypothetical protein CO105_11140 [Comamonadaceae bacterium CG_4_9_14_3_um_filter_60_33]|nr:MAG: hypothetical protein COZ09_01360 [Comamonadaceae bacterium CG_4_10_14_3_um_filter_60_42]PJB42489.1 MAG: hypothetical protein CO105_11140 [Comamonadaceae bacterium CG_4_9_14_3_um_filter_60_33]
MQGSYRPSPVRRALIPKPDGGQQRIRQMTRRSGGRSIVQPIVASPYTDWGFAWPLKQLSATA